MSKKIESHNNQIKEGMKKIQEIIEKLSFEDGNEMAFLNQFIPNTFPFIFSELECQMQELKSKLSKLQLGFLIEKLNELAPVRVFAELCNCVISLKLFALAGS